jgi:hypothetical protein
MPSQVVGEDGTQSQVCGSSGADKLFSETLVSKRPKRLNEGRDQYGLGQSFLVHKSKQRLTKLTQLLIRSRKLEKVGR